MKVTQKSFGTINNQPVDKFCLSNDYGMEVHIINYGAIVQAVYLPNQPDKKTNVVLGFDTLKDYQEKKGYFGAVVGRCANRIHQGKVTIEGKPYQLICNTGENHLHGGPKGFDTKVWDATSWQDNNNACVTLSYYSPDGEEHYPGNLQVKVTYTLTNENKLKIDYAATTDKITIVNLTQHTYFNLNGKGDCLSHQLKINASRFLATDAASIPLPGIESVENTPMDFRQKKCIEQDIYSDDTQLKQAKGYDHCWIIDKSNDEELTLAASAECTNNCKLDVYTDQPGIQFYSGNYLSERTQEAVANQAGFALETQQLPNAANRLDFPSPLISPEKPYRHKTEWHFFWN